MTEYMPKSSYIPTTDEIETGFHEFASWLETKYPGEYENAPEFADWREAMHGFRRWLAENNRKVSEKSWDECVTQMPLDLDWKNQYSDLNPYRPNEK
jgi:hypothetical protein